MKTPASAQTLPVTGYAAHLQLGYFNQHQLEALDLDASCIAFTALNPKASEQAIRNFLGVLILLAIVPLSRFVTFPVKRRAWRWLLLPGQPNLLLLDEPTNHLDLEVRHALTLALH